jgi:hypothetical protein
LHPIVTAADQVANREARLGGIAGVVVAEITEAVGRLKTVSPTGGLARTARALGIGLGD